LGRPVSAQKAMVVTANQYATDIGIQILQRGGNAIDAAVAISFALAVSYPQAGNIGGGGFMLLRDNNGEVYTLDYREKAPIGATKDMYLEEGGKVIENSSTIGYLASGVPGTVAGLFEAHRKFGILSWAELIDPAIKLAQEGFIIDHYQAEVLEEKHETFLQFESSTSLFTRNGQCLQSGDTLIQTDLAETLRRIQKNGPDDFYSGITARKIADDMEKYGGIITLEDLKRYNAVWRKPIHFTYRDYDLYSMAPPSSGGIMLAQIFNALENINIASLGHNSSDMIHIWIEIERQAYANRAAHLGDSDYYDVPLEALIDKEYGKEIFDNINPYFARSSGVVDSQQDEHTETTHFSVVDPFGNSVSSTYTLNGSHGSGVVITGTGILMNNEMDDFAIKPSFPNLYGLIGGEANSISGEKRMLSSMTPTIITKNDSLFLILGSPGGSKIITSVAQVISNVIDHNLNIRQAVEAPRFHHQWLPDIVYYEKLGFSNDVLYNLHHKGHNLNKTGSIGCIQAILWNNRSQEWTGWSDPRRNGECKGF
jgi:gamma-glutamyltranspeptidase/glutathione hydrolase